MAAARYWRVVAVQVPAGADLELRHLHLMGSGGRVDTSATLVASIAPIEGAVSALQDGDELTRCRFAGESVRAGGFALTWDLGAAQDVVALKIQGTKVRNAPWLMLLLRSDDGVLWAAEVQRSLVTTPAYDGEFVLCSVGSSFIGSLLASAAAYSGNSSPPQTYNVSATETPTWQSNYVATATIGAFSYLGTVNAPAIAPRVSKTMPFFLDESWAVSSFNGHYYGDYANLDVEFLAGEAVVAALSVRRAGEFFNGVFYGPSLAALMAAPRYGSYPHTDGTITFAANKIIFTQNPSSQNTYSFEYLRDMSQVTAIRISVEAMATYSSGGSAVMTLRLQNSARGTGDTRVYPIQSMVLRGLFAATSDVPQMRHQRIAGPLLAHDAEFGGAGRIFGSTKIKGTPNLPTKARVRLLRDRDGLLARETWSDPTTGAFAFDGIDTNQKFTTLAADANGDFRPVAANQLTPEVP